MSDVSDNRTEGESAGAGASAPAGAEAIAIPADLLAAVYREARRAFPAECCGWLVGPRGAGEVDAIRTCDNAQELGDNPAAPERGAETAYVIPARDLLAFARSFDGERPARVLYHSHPNGRAYFSRVDAEVATIDGEPAYPVQQLVVGIDGERVTESALFAWSDERRAFVEIARYPGADV